MQTSSAKRSETRKIFIFRARARALVRRQLKTATLARPTPCANIYLLHMSSFLPTALDCRSLVFRNRARAQAACFSDIAAGVRLVNHAPDKGERKALRSMSRNQPENRNMTPAHGIAFTQHTSPLVNEVHSYRGFPLAQLIILGERQKQNSQ